MPSIPSFAPRGIIGMISGRLGSGVVELSSDLRQWMDTLGNVISRLDEVQTGTLRATLAQTAPEGWLLCNGQTVEKYPYRDLYAVLGGTYGETSTTFTLPDMRDAVVRGAGATALGALGGSNELTLTTAQLPSHTHPTTSGEHTHEVNDPGHGHSGTALPHTHEATVTTDGEIAEKDAEDGAAAGTDKRHVKRVEKVTVTVELAEAMAQVRVHARQTGVTVAPASADVTVGEAGGGEAVTLNPRHVAVNWMVKT